MRNGSQSRIYLHRSCGLGLSFFRPLFTTMAFLGAWSGVHSLSLGLSHFRPLFTTMAFPGACPGRVIGARWSMDHHGLWHCLPETVVSDIWAVSEAQIKKEKSWVDQLVFMNIEIKLVGKIIKIVFVIYCLRLENQQWTHKSLLIHGTFNEEKKSVCQWTLIKFKVHVTSSTVE